MLGLAARQHGVVSVGQLRANGLSDSAVRMRVQAGRLHRLFRGVYAVGRPDVPPRGRRLAAVLACGPGALLSHFACADHLGLRQSNAAVTDVTVPRRSSLRHPGIRIHRSTTLVDEDRTIADATPCTSWARTLLDIAPLIDDRALEKAVERSEILELYDHPTLERLLDRMWGQPGTRRLAIAVGIARPGRTVTNGPLEELMLALCRDWGLPEPEVNAEILLGGERAQVDFLWREQRVVVEVDGFRYHRGRAAFRRDRRRDRLLELAGFGHARFADEDFDRDRPEIRGTLARLLDLSSRG